MKVFTAVAIAVLVALALTTAAQKNSVSNQVSKAVVADGANVPAKPSDEQLRKNLTDLQYEVTQQCGTEPPFQNAYWNNHRAGIYVDVVSGEPLFSSLDKFDSGSGWPSFTKPLPDVKVTEKVDTTVGMQRTEVRSPKADSHLGHVFNDGPGPTRLRYCINSAALRFVGVEDMEKAGFAAYMGPFVKAGLVKAPAPGAPTPAGKTSGQTNASTGASLETATLAGGCFWGMEEILRKIPGIVKTTVGYTGGTFPNPTYKVVCTGLTGHAEAIEIVFDTNKISYAGVLGYFFRMHDPTTLNQQHNDIGTQYRSAIFFHSDAQKQTAEAVKASVDKSHKWNAPVVTQIVAAKEFYPAEEYHQAYLQKNPDGYNCHFLRD